MMLVYWWDLRNPSFRSDLRAVFPVELTSPLAVPTMHVTLQGFPSSSTSLVSLPSPAKTERAERRASVMLLKCTPTSLATSLALSPVMGPVNWSRMSSGYITRLSVPVVSLAERSMDR